MFKSFIVRHFSSFTCFNTTQFLGALNDNVYKLLLIFFLLQLEGIEKSPEILAFTGALFVLPFLLFSSISGTLADRFSKSNIIVATKILELVITAAAVVAFAFESIWGAYTVLFGIATQSAIFGPSKYGILPELVPSERIAKANGMITSFTFLACIVGTFLASFITQVSGRNFIAGAILCVMISIIGLIASFYIGYTPPVATEVKKRKTRLTLEIYHSLKLAKQQSFLLPACLGSAFFLFAGAFMQLNIIPFAIQSLGLTDVGGGYLFLVIAFGMGLGSFLAGKISGTYVELGIVPIGALGIATCSFLLDSFSTSLPMVIILCLLIGTVSGLYVIPLDSYIQLSSPNQQRGQIIAAVNFLSFLGVLLASGFVYLVSDLAGLSPAQGFTTMGWIVLAVCMVYAFEFFDHLTRFIASVFSKLHFRTVWIQKEIIPNNIPAIYICHHTAWNDMLLILAAQKRRMRFFIDQEQPHSSLMKRFYKLLGVATTPSTFDTDADSLHQSCQFLSKGFSVCFLIHEADVEKTKENLENTVLKEWLETNPHPIIPVLIGKEVKVPTSPLFQRLRSKLRVPATIAFGSQS